MIELRWVTGVELPHPQCDALWYGKARVVLQYRTATVSVGSDVLAWSDWEDVPVVPWSEAEEGADK